MPQYFFSIRAGNENALAERAAELNDDAAALAYACEIVRELMQNLTCIDRNSRVTVRDETRPMVLSFPSLRRALSEAKRESFKLPQGGKHGYRNREIF
jgi:hypothetical protein